MLESATFCISAGVVGMVSGWIVGKNGEECFCRRAPHRDRSIPEQEGGT